MAAGMQPLPRDASSRARSASGKTLGVWRDDLEVTGREATCTTLDEMGRS